MKKSFILIATILNMGVASSSFAAQDQALIQETRKNQLAHDAREASTAPAATKKVALPLDHGPRAMTTPWGNQQRASQPQDSGNAPVSEKGN